MLRPQRLQLAASLVPLPLARLLRHLQLPHALLCRLRPRRLRRLLGAQPLAQPGLLGRGGGAPGVLGLALDELRLERPELLVLRRQLRVALRQLRRERRHLLRRPPLLRPPLRRERLHLALVHLRLLAQLPLEVADAALPARRVLARRVEL